MDPFSFQETSFSTPLSAEEVVDKADVQHLHDIIADSHLEETEEPENGQTYQVSQNAQHQTVLTFNLAEIFRRGAINLVLPFINGVMLGFGEILAHEIGFKYGFVGARVQPPRRMQKPRFL